ncbi:Presenilin-domain-containing protein [Dichotomocladium elegans]|nr:Presenilin-domain-containing protein [Dichotomocladium elegans]
MTQSSPNLCKDSNDEMVNDETTVTANPVQPIGEIGCIQCRKSATFMCSSCGLSGPRYCSVECQKIDWKQTHHKDCEATKLARRTRLAERARRQEAEDDTATAADNIPLEDLNSQRGINAGPAPDDEGRVDIDEDGDSEGDLKFYMQQIYFVIKPVVACIILSIFWVKVAYDDTSDYSPTRPGYIIISSSDDNMASSDGNNGNSESHSGLVNSLANAFIIIGQIIVITVVIVFLFRKGWMRVLVGFFMMVVLLLLGFMTYLLLLNLIQVFAIPMDYITMVFALWNFTVVGLVSIFWKGPLWLQQAYLTVMSSLMAFSLTGLEEWTTWILLGLLAVWDLIAVLCPFGPLRLLIESSRKQQREVPALLYSVNAVWFMMATSDDVSQAPSHVGRKLSTAGASVQSSYTVSTDCEPSTSSIAPLNTYAVTPATSATTSTAREDHLNAEFTLVQTQRRNSNCTTLASTNDPGRVPGATETEDTTVAEAGDSSQDEEDVERSGLKLGLGDFVFYSVLIARAALYDWITTVCCTIAVLMGLTATIFLLAIYKKALPALPISIAFGILFYFVAKTVLVPYVGALCAFGLVGF